MIPKPSAFTQDIFGKTTAALLAIAVAFAPASASAALFGSKGKKNYRKHMADAEKFLEFNEYIQAIEQLKLAIAEAEKLSSRSGYLKDALVKLADLHMERADPKSAEPLYRRAFKEMKKNYSPWDTRLQVGALQLADACRLSGKPDDAAQLYKEAIENIEKREGRNHPAAGRGYHGLGIVQAHRGEFGKAEASYRAAIAAAMSRNHKVYQRGTVTEGIQARYSWRRANTQGAAASYYGLYLLTLQKGDYTGSDAALAEYLSALKAAGAPATAIEQAQTKAAALKQQAQGGRKIQFGVGSP